MASKQLNRKNFFILVTVCVTNNSVYVLSIIVLAWGHVFGLAHLEELLLSLLFEILIKPVILNLLVRREIFLHEDHWVHLVMKLSAFWTIGFFPESFTFKLETDKVGPCHILFKCFEMSNILFDFFLRPLFGGLPSLKFGFILKNFEWIPSLVLGDCLFLQALFDQVHVVVILLIDFV